eukprot:5788450-Pleurochrysis_carterae.AAC.1
MHSQRREVLSPQLRTVTTIAIKHRMPIASMSMHRQRVAANVLLAFCSTCLARRSTLLRSNLWAANACDANDLAHCMSQRVWNASFILGAHWLKAFYNLSAAATRIVTGTVLCLWQIVQLQFSHAQSTQILNVIFADESCACICAQVVVSCCSNDLALRWPIVPSAALLEFDILDFCDCIVNISNRSVGPSRTSWLCLYDQRYVLLPVASCDSVRARF